MGSRPVIVGVILGPVMETQARRALTVVLLLLAVAAFVIPHPPALKKRLAFGEDD